MRSSDKACCSFIQKVGLSCFRGSEEDVLSRVIGAAEYAGADVIVEISGDCPLIDPELISQCIEIHKHIFIIVCITVHKEINFSC